MIQDQFEMKAASAKISPLAATNSLEDDDDN